MSNTARTVDEMVAVVREAIERIAPDVDAQAIPGDVEYRDEAELDSMDFLAVLTTVADRTGVAVPELDYPDITTIDRFASYLVEHAADAGRVAG
jgi:acyl carrier protein